MKLYTEEQVRMAIQMSDKYHYLLEEEEDGILKSLTPIELPSDGEIIEVSHNIKYTQFNPFANGAIWMRDKIQGGNK
jgi:predicted DNA-binding antitoxin AbrB/MazE fold protein